jgi:hypothetical protein
MTELVGLLLGCGCTNDRSHAGLTPLGHLLAAALTELLDRAMVRMEAGRAVVQVGCQQGAKGIRPAVCGSTGAAEYRHKMTGHPKCCQPAG